MSLIKWNPFWESDEVDRFFGPSTFHPGAFVPSIDVYQDKENVYVETPLPYIDPKKINLSVEDDVLTIEGETEKKSEVEDKEYYRKEVRYGSFHRAIALPASVKGEQAKAVYEKGVLKITVPKDEKAKPRKVEIDIKE